MAGDPRYSTAAWQKTRRMILQRDGYQCQIQGPRCKGYADTAHHIIPSSQRPDLFFDPNNLAAACKPCNFGGGGKVGAENRNSRITLLENIIEAQAQRINELAEQIMVYERERNSPPAKNPPTPAIY
jgi:hypothetical protein